MEDEGTSPWYGGVKKEKKACLSRSFFIWCRVLSGPEIIGILTTLPQLFSVTAERENFLARGCLLEKGAGYQTVTAQLEWLLYSYICDRPRSVRPKVPGPEFVTYNYLHKSGNYAYRIK